MSQDTRYCRVCKLEKPLSDFVKNKCGLSGYEHKCRSCKNIRRQERLNGEKQPQYISSKLKKAYGITSDDYDRMYADQGGRCAICGEHQSTMSKRLSVDHCHETKIVRGLLCQHCNFVLGHARDSIMILQKAIAYLNQTEE